MSRGNKERRMTHVQLLSQFLQTIQDDPRITSKHISLYLVLIQQSGKDDINNPIILKRVSLMQSAKISARPTYLKCLKDLHQSGYIQYVPALHRHSKSIVYLSATCGK